MANGTRTPVRTKLGALFMLIGLLTGTFSVFAPRAEAIAVTTDPAGTRTGFEIEGNQTSQVAGKLDWQALAGLTPATDADSLTIITDDTLDSGLQGTSKENDPSGWVCNTGGDNPPKADILKAAVNVRTPDTGGPFLDLAFVRSTGEGSSHVNFEFNQNPITNPCPHTGRTTGDLLLVVDFPGGSEAGNVEVFLWDSTISADGQWVLNNSFPANKAAAASNGSDAQNVANDITDYIFGQGTITTRRFGEASIDLSAVLPTGTGTCVSFGEVNIRSRSSGSSIESALQDRLPGTPIDLSTCAKIKIKKVDNSVPPVPTAGAVYGLYDSLAKAQAVAGQTDEQAIAAAFDTCTTGADGTCTFDEVNPDTDYWITEITPPAGLLPSTEIRFVDGDDVDPLSTVDLTGTPFVNNVPVGNVTITKRLFEDDNGNGTLDPGEQVTPDDASDLDGITFTLQQGGVTSKTHPAGADASCTITGGTGQCTISSVRLGTYDIVETLNPNGPSGIGLGSSPQVTITTNGQTVTANYDNPLAPINISLDKKGVDWANVGDVITYTFDVTTTGVPLTVDDVEEITDLPNGFDDRCTTTAMTGPNKSTTIDPDNDGDNLLEAGETWQWTCQYTVLLSDATDAIDGIELWNKATVTGEDDLGRTVSADDTHLVRIKLPDVSVDKTPDDGVINPGDNAVFTIKVRNAADDGNDPPEGIARSVTLTDDLPDGIDWSTTNLDCTITPDVGTVDQELSCSFGDLAPGDEETVTVTGATTVANCGRLPNTASASATNELQSDLENNSDDGLITVSCADVTVDKVADEDPINAGDTASFDITVTNLSATAAATGVTLSDTLPTGVSWTLSGADADDCDISAGVLTCDFGTIEASGTRTVTVSGLTDADDCGTITNTAVVGATNEAPGTGDNNSSTDTIDVECPDVWVEKDADSATVSAGDTITWTISFGNDGPGDAYDVDLTDNLPTALTGYVLGGTDAALCDLTGTTLTCDIEVMDAGAEYEITITGTTDTADCGLVTNPVSIAADNEHEDDDANNTDSSSVTVQCPDIDITKVADDDVVTAGDEVGFTITVSNDGPGTAYGVTLNDPLPTGDGISWSIDSQTPGSGCAIAAGTLTCGPVDLADGESFSVHVTSDTDPAGAECIGGTLPNTATADATNDDPEQASDTITIQCPDLTIEKVADDASVSAGEEIGFTITVTNNGPGTAYGVTLSDPLPDGDGVDWSIDSESGDVDADCEITGAVGSQELDCGPVDLGVDKSFSVHVTSDTDPTTEECIGGELDNTATADASNDGSVQDSADITILCPGLNVVKTADDTTVSAGDDIGFGITVSNEEGEGIGTAFGVTLDDPLPAGDGISWSIDGESGDVDAACEITGAVGSQVLSCGPVDLDPGDSFTVHVTSGTTPSGAECSADVLDNTATADADNAGEETDDASITIQCPDISITKVADDDVVDAGDDIGFTIEVSNAGPGTAYDVEITDPLPTASGVSWSVDPAVAGCLIVLNQLTCDVGDLASGESFEVHVTGTTPGGLDNEDLPAACTVYDNTATVSLSNDASEEASDFTEVICPLDITIEKDGPDLAHRGDEITYTFEVTNSGKADLVDVELTDPICDEGTLALVDDGDGDTTLAIGEVWTFECTRVITEDDPDPLPNTATVVGTDERERTTEDEDDHLVDIITPVIDVDKTVDDETPDVGQTVTFTYVVTNTGDTTLYDVEVVDDQLGPVGTIAQLEPGESSTLTMTMVVAPDSPTINVATATGEDILGLEVSDEDDATIAIVLPNVIERPRTPQVAPQQLPRTGADSDVLLVLAGGLLLLGGFLVATGEGLALRPARRRRD